MDGRAGGGPYGICVDMDVILWDRQSLRRERQRERVDRVRREAKEAVYNIR